MIGYVLAAGFGTRLQPITDMIPKALVPVCGVPLIEVALRYFRKNSLELLAANVHYQAEVLEMFVDRLPYKVNLFNEQPDILGTGGAIFNARDFLSTDTTFAVLNSDIVLNFPLVSVIEKFEKSDALCALISTQDHNRATIVSNAAGEYCGTVGDLFQEGTVESSFVGLALYKKEALEFFKDDDFSVVPVWKRMVQSGAKVEVWVEDFYWQDSGTPSQLFTIYKDVLDKKLKFDFPLGITVDFDKKRAWSNNLLPSIFTDNSKYCWVENVDVETVTGENTIFFSGVSIDKNRTYKDSVVLPWCEVALEQ